MEMNCPLPRLFGVLGYVVIFLPGKKRSCACDQELTLHEIILKKIGFDLSMYARYKETGFVLWVDTMGDNLKYRKIKSYKC